MPAAPESVHLCAWPVADEQAIDAGVSFDMAAARRVVELGRAARNGAAVKTRQPLAEVVVALPEAEAQAVERLRDVVLDELNVKDLRFVGGEDELVAYVVKPNLKVLGPKLGKRMGPLQAALREADGAAIVAAVRADGAAVIVLPDGEISLVEEELLIETGSPEGYQVESEAGRVVALKTDVDDALREEGTGARAHPRGSARAQSCRPSYRRHRQPHARRAGAASPAGRAPSRRHHGRDARQRVLARRAPPATTSRRRGWTVTRSVSVSA